MSRAPKVVREHQRLRRAELGVLEAARDYAAAVDDAERKLEVPFDDQEAREQSLDRRVAVAEVEAAARRMERAAIRYAELAPRRRRRRGGAR